jgi:Protein of unknown function (DUF4239)
LLSTAFFGGVVVLASVLTAIAGLIVARRLIPLPVRERHTAATGTIYAAVYVMFGLSAGFSLFSVWQQFQTARQTAETEASSVETIYRLAGGFPEPGRGRVQQSAESYVREVVEGEWPLLERGRSSARAGTLLDELRRDVQGVEPATDAQGALRTEALAELDELEEGRVLRLVLVREGLPYILWVVLVVGGTLTIAFPYLFGIDAAWLHTATVAGLTVLVALILYVIGVLDYPFGGGVGVQPYPFEEVLRAIGGNGGGGP